MIRALLIGAMMLFLSGCATSPVSGDSHGSDLEVLRLGVQAMLPTRDPAGEVQLAENAETNDEAWTLLLDLEEVDWLHEQDKLRVIGFVNAAVDRIIESRQPTCTFLWVEYKCKE